VIASAAPPLLAEAAGLAGVGDPDLDRLARLGAWLQAVAPRLGDLTDAAATARRRRRLMLADPPGGPLLALLWLGPGVTTGIHGHGSWGVVLVLEGRDRYQCWQPAGGGAARLADVRELRGGDVAWFAGPPGDVHCQQALGEGVLELLLFGRDPRAMPRTTYRPEVMP
jgi:predicted metal-dependent enzyme (double-stranded beta helix superfamily)